MKTPPDSTKTTRRVWRARPASKRLPTMFLSMAWLGALLLMLPFTPRVVAAETAKATFGAGCFWCVEAIYERGGGVLNVVSGYAGGTELNPTYEQVGGGKTSHAEVVQITFDPTVISYEKLLALFWKTHDPTDPRGVAPDFGRQYRSTLLYHDEEQRKAIEISKAEAQKGFSKPIATEVAPLGKFYPAEDYHQDYVRKNPNDSYVRSVAIPKLKKLGLLGPGAPKNDAPRKGTPFSFIVPAAAALGLVAVIVHRRRAGER